MTKAGRTGCGVPDRGGQTGFTVIELVISISVLVILLALAAPSFSMLLSQKRVASSTETLVADLRFARTEAIMRNVPLLVCAKNSATSNCSASLNWQFGWVVCVDADDDGQCDAPTTSAPNPIRMHGSPGDGVTVSGPAAPLRFNGTGNAAATTVLSISGNVMTTPIRVVQVATSGHVRSY